MEGSWIVWRGASRKGEEGGGRGDRGDRGFRLGEGRRREKRRLYEAVAADLHGSDGLHEALLAAGPHAGEKLAQSAVTLRATRNRRGLPTGGS